jgi:hypothetical protein
MGTLELEVTADGRGGYLVAARSDAGDTTGTATCFPFDTAALDRRLRAVRRALVQQAASSGPDPAAAQPATELGTHLFGFLFPGGLGAHLAAARNQAAHEDAPVQVRLRIRPPELAALPWELLYDPDRDEYLCLSTSVVRYLDLLEPRRPLAVAPPLRILALAAHPDGSAKLNAGLEKRQLEQALAGLERSGQVQLGWVGGQTWRDLQDALDSGSWHVLHLIGHGRFDPASQEGVVLLADAAGGACPLTARDLGMLLSDHRSLRLVVLNACESGRAGSGDLFSSTAAVLMRRGIPAVVAMQHDITDSAAIVFARGLYGAVAARLPIDQAVTRARRAIKLSQPGTLEWATPVLYLRSATAHIFGTEDQSAATTPPAGEPHTDTGSGDQARQTQVGTIQSAGPVTVIGGGRFGDITIGKQ